MNFFTSTGRRQQFFLVVVFVVTVTTYYFWRFREEGLGRTAIILLQEHDNISVPGFLVHTPGCRIPDMNPFDKSVLPYISPVDSMSCGPSPLIQSNQTSIWIDVNILDEYNVTDLSELDCCYRGLHRLVEKKENADTSIEFDIKCFEFEESANIYEEFIEVICKKGDKVMYKDYHAFIVPKKKEIVWKDTIKQDDLSVLIIGADSLSRLNFHRQLPKTKRIMKLLGAIEFFGYNKVEDNTFPNLIPLLTGYSVEELPKVCWPQTSDYFDDCPFIWKNFSEKNYYTLLAEDAYWIGIFNYKKNGFKDPPTDYYTRPYILANEKFTGHTRLLNTYFCDGSRFSAEVLFDYAYKFSVNMTLSNKKFWAMFWESSLTHDFLNNVPNTDDIFYNLLQKLHEEGVFNHTVLFFLSDHGMRWGKIRETYQGRMEEHLPFLNILLPEGFRKKYRHAVSNLKINTNLLTTHFDVYDTMIDLLDTNSITDENLKKRSEKGLNKRGRSLFLPISVYRTCKSAGIQPMWCTCQKSKTVSVIHPKVKKAAVVSVQYINNLLKNSTLCAKLKLSKIITAHIEEEEKLVISETTSVYSDYVVIFMTKPGLAKFEATVRHRSDNKEMVVLGGISRINTYGSQSTKVYAAPAAAFYSKFIDKMRLKLAN